MRLRQINVILRIVFFVFVGYVLEEIMPQNSGIAFQDGTVEAFTTEYTVHVASIAVDHRGEFPDRDVFFFKYLPDVFSYMHNLLFLSLKLICFLEEYCFQLGQ